MSLPIRPLPHSNDRPADTLIDTIIVHSMTAGDQCTVEQCVQLLDAHTVSAHYLIGRDGEIWQCVSEELRAWHAGASVMPFENDNRPGVNDFSIGIELITFTDHTFTSQQYESLAKLIREISLRHPLQYVLGHEHIAPGRKTDPGPHFDWIFLSSLIKDLNLKLPNKTIE